MAEYLIQFWREVGKLLPGDLVDLANDSVVDKDGKGENHGTFEMEYQTVAFSRQETPETVLVGFEGYDWVGFPTGHKVLVGGFDKDYLANTDYVHATDPEERSA